MQKIITLLFLLILSSCKSSYLNDFQLNSSDIAKDEFIAKDHVFNSFGCDGENISPQLSWKNPPEGTKSFALTVYDPDAPTGSGWWHWVVLNIPKHHDNLARGFGDKEEFRLKNDITQIKNDYGTYTYGGPCPPKGDKPHRYIFTIHALKTSKIMLNRSDSAAKAGFMINANSIGTASFSAKFGRN